MKDFEKGVPGPLRPSWWLREACWRSMAGSRCTWTLPMVARLWKIHVCAHVELLLPGARNFTYHLPTSTTPQPPPPSHIAAGAPSNTLSKMTYQLPPMLLNLFAPRPPLRWVEPIDHAPEKRCTPKIGGVGQYLQAMREYKDNDGYVPTDSWLQKRDRKKIEKKENQEKLLTEGIQDCMLPIHSAPLLVCSFVANTAHRQAQRRPQGPGRRLQDSVRLPPCIRRNL